MSDKKEQVLDNYDWLLILMIQHFLDSGAVISYRAIDDYLYDSDYAKVKKRMRKLKSMGVVSAKRVGSKLYEYTLHTEVMDKFALREKLTKFFGHPLSNGLF